MFDYFTSVNALDSILCNAPLAGVQDSVNTDFTLAAGQIRLAPDSTPQAVLVVSTVIQEYVPPPAVPSAGEWTLIVTATPSPSQTVRLGTAPAPIDVLRFIFAVLA